MAVVQVLVVDDEAVVRRAMAMVVEETDGFAVAGLAASGEESLTAAATSRPDLVLMDVNLPGIDGIEAARRMRSVDPRPIVLLLSTYDEGEVDVDTCGAAGYINKAAFGPDRLAEAWAAAIDRPVPDEFKELP